MTTIKAYVADHPHIAKTYDKIISAIEMLLIMGLCLGTAPALIWLAKLSYI